MRFLSFAAAALYGASIAHALSTIKAVGNKFFDADGNQFFMKGTPSSLPLCDDLN